MLSVDDVLEILSIPLLGIVPESEDVLRASNVGAPIILHNAMSPAARAYSEAAKRLCGEKLPVNIPADKRGLFVRLFGRRAA
jgi:septum site-determining protein MinD